MLTATQNAFTNLWDFSAQGSALQSDMTRGDLAHGLGSMSCGIVSADDTIATPGRPDNEHQTGVQEWGFPYTPIDTVNNGTHIASMTRHINLQLPYLPANRDTCAGNMDGVISSEFSSLEQAGCPLQREPPWPTTYGEETFESNVNLDQNLPTNSDQFQQFTQWDLDLPGHPTNITSYTDPLDLIPLFVADYDTTRSQPAYNHMDVPLTQERSSAPGNIYMQSIFAGPTLRSQPVADIEVSNDPQRCLLMNVPEGSRSASEWSWEQINQPTPSVNTENSQVIIGNANLTSDFTSGVPEHVSESGLLLFEDGLLINGPSMTREASEEIEEVLGNVNPSHSTTLLLLKPQPSHVPSMEAPKDEPFVSGFKIIEDTSATATPKKRKRMLAPERRPVTKAIRLTGACVRCKMLKESCSLGTPCNRCEKEMNRADIYHGACYRESIKEVKLVRLGSGKANQPRVKFIDYLWKAPDAPPKMVQLSWVLPEKTVLELPTLEAPLHEISPRQRDLLHEEWHVKGALKEVYLLPYAAYDKSCLTNNVLAFIEESRPKVHHMMLNGLEDSLTRLTFQEADRYARVYDSEIIDLAFCIRTTEMLSAGWGSLIGHETLGTPTVDSAERGYCGRCPLPVPLAHQIDVIFVDAMEIYERKLVEKLNHKLYSKKSKAWFEIFLGYFIIMTHLKFIHTQAVGFMRSREQTASAGQVSYIVREMVNKWNYSAGNMLYYSNHILNGERPFALAANNITEVKKRGNLDNESTTYIQEILSVLNESGNSPGTHFTESPREDEPSERWIYKLFRGE